MKCKSIYRLVEVLIDRYQCAGKRTRDGRGGRGKKRQRKVNNCQHTIAYNKLLKYAIFAYIITALVGTNSFVKVLVI